MKALSLDIGDIWIGSALSDGAGITCRPYKTVRVEALDSFLAEVLDLGEVDTIVVGHPITVGGKISAQTKSVEAFFDKLREKFSPFNWVLWDERFSTQRAISVLKGKKRQKKEREHSIAAAFILQSYLDNKAL
jgi:putative transcription antitermination factor YqgF